MLNPCVSACKVLYKMPDMDNFICIKCQMYIVANYVKIQYIVAIVLCVQGNKNSGPDQGVCILFNIQGFSCS